MATTEWRITQKPDFLQAMLALPPKEVHQVLEKINLPAHVFVNDIGALPRI